MIIFFFLKPSNLILVSFMLLPFVIWLENLFKKYITLNAKKKKKKKKEN